MEYGRFLAVILLLIITALTIYIGCLRSYAIYFFERDSRRVVFLEPWSAAGVPVGLSFMLIISYLTSKRSRATSEDFTAKKLHKTSQNADSRKISRSSDLESISESPTDLKQDQNLSSVSESENENPVEEEDVSGGDTRRQSGRKSGVISGSNDQINEDVFDSAPAESAQREASGDEAAKEGPPENDSNVIFTLNYPDNVSGSDYFPTPSRKSSRRSSGATESHTELRAQRKQSEIYKQIGKISLVPMSLKKFSFQMAPEPTSPLRRFRKDSLFDVLIQLLGIHLPIWLSVIAVHITLVEVLNVKFYTVFYYHHPGMKLFAMIVSVMLGLFHEWKPTYFVNNVLGLAAAYVIIGRVQTVSYVAGVVFLVGMILFDIFWMYGIDLLSTVTKEARAPIMVIIPWGAEGRKEMLATLDIIVPGIFLNIVLKFADMYDSGAFLPPFYAVIVGLIATLAVAIYRGRSTPAMVLPGLFTIATSLLCVHRPGDLWRFEIKH